MKTPIIADSRSIMQTKKASSRFWIEVQLDRMAMGTSSVVKSTSQRLMPSTPTS